MTEPLSNLLPSAIKTLATQLFSKAGLGIYLLEQRTPFEGEGAQLLHANEWQRLQGFASEKRQREYYSGRLACKLALKSLLSVAPQQLADWEVSNDQQGRPLLLGPGSAECAGLQVSLAHSAEHCLAVVTSQHCGVDLQLITPQLTRVQERFCLPGEEELLGLELGEASFLIGLGLLWAAKEAARKLLSQWGLPGFLELQLCHLEKRLEQTWLLKLQVNLQGQRQQLPFVAASWNNYCLSLGILEQESHA